ncbi:hypothetical protein RYX36_010889 [Vicia faba]
MLKETEDDWINVISRSYRDTLVLEIKPADDKDVVTNLGCNAESLTVDSSQLVVSAGTVESRLHLLEENAIIGVFFST